MNNFFILNKNIKLNIITHSLEKNPDAILIHLHGLHRHFQFVDNNQDNFYNRIKYFKKANILSYGLEFRGHGKSDGKKGCIDNVDFFISDIKRLLEYIEHLHHNIPIYLLAESMGGAIGIKTSILYEKIDGIILLAPLIGLAEESKPNNFTVKILLKLAKIFPNIKLHRKYKIRKKNYIKYNDNLKLPDEINKNIIDLNTINQCFELVKFIKSNNNKFNKPLLIIHSNTDNITCINSSKDFFNKCSSNDKEIFILENSNHILLKPKDKDDFIPNVILSKITNWINNRI